MSILNVLFFVVLSRVSSIEHDSRYKRTWGIGGGDGEIDANGAKVVIKQPSGVRNGQPGQMNAPAPSGPYIKRWAPAPFALCFLIT